MLSIAIGVVLVTTLMIVLAARRGRRRPNWSRYLKGSIDENLSLGTLASGTLVSGNFDETVSEEVRISSIRCIWTMGGKTIGDGSGPIMVGVAHSDYSTAEIQAVIDATASWNTGDLVAKEVAKRLVRRVGVFNEDGPTANNLVLNEGRPITTKLNWLLKTSATLKVWAFNMGTGALATTVPVVRLQGHANLWGT